MTVDCSRSHEHALAGQSLVEFAIIGSLLITMLLGLVDFALAFNSQMVIRSAVAEGGYYISQNPGDEAGAAAHIRQDMQVLDGFDDTARTVITFTPSSCVSGRRDMTIHVTYEHAFMFSAVLPAATVDLQSSTTVPLYTICT